MPDRRQGYTRRGATVLPPDPVMAARYRDNMVQRPAEFTAQIQQAMIDELCTACKRQGYQLYAVGTDATHLHVLVGWRTDRPWLRTRAGLQSSLSRRLNRQFERRPWFAEHPSRKRVRDRSHHDYLINTYVPKHKGWKWDHKRGLYR